MSGICCVIDWHGDGIPPGTLHHMTAATPHRAVHGTHTWTSRHAHLAHQSHHTTPQDDNGPGQPLTRGHLTLTADARIDNRPELLPTLQPYLQTNDPSDAEVILAAHMHWSHDAPHHLIGDYAYTLWNETTHTLTAARDPMGMRALYYHTTPRRLTLATEIKNLLQAPGVPTELNETTLAHFLTGHHHDLHATHYRHIQQLPPGHTLHATQHHVRTERHWSPDPHHRIHHDDERDYTQHFLDIFGRAVHDRTRTTRPIGLLLSGGMDSGAIAATLGHQRTPHVHTYSWAFPTLPGSDETAISDGIVRHYGLSSRHVPGDDAWPLKDYPAHGPDRDGPFTGVYQPLIDRTLDAARDDGVGPLLTGDKGDETVGDWVFDHPGMWASGRFRAAWAEIGAHAHWAGVSRGTILRRHLLAPVANRLRPGRSVPARPLVPAFLHPDWARRLQLDAGPGAQADAPAFRDPARALRYRRIFSHVGLLDPIPRARDCARRGLELRNPWSDRRLAEFVLAVPQWIVQRPGQPKRIARQAMRGIMPDEVLDAARKTTPDGLFDRGLKERGYATAIDLLEGSQLAARGFVDEAALRADLEALVQGRSVRNDPWWALCAEMWLRRYWT